VLVLNRSQVAPALVVALFLQLGCGGEDTPIDGDSSLPPPPVAVNTAAPPPTATPAPSGLCANGNMPVAAFDIKVFTVKRPDGSFREDFAQTGPFYVGEKIRFDSQGKDRFGRRTDGCEQPRWDWYDDDCGMLNADKGWQPVASVLKECEFTIEANHDHIAARENPLKLTFLSAAHAPQP